MTTTSGRRYDVWKEPPVRSKGDYRLKPDAEVFQKIPGFQPIPFEKTGLIQDREGE